MKNFIVEMDEKAGCDYCDYQKYDGTIFGTCRKKCKYCDGNFNKRPEFCPLREVRYLPEKSHDLDGRMWVEVESE
jgi:hypothetical protein